MSSPDLLTFLQDSIRLQLLLLCKHLELCSLCVIIIGLTAELCALNQMTREDLKPSVDPMLTINMTDFISACFHFVCLLISAN